MVDLPDEKIGCHHTGFTKKCRTLVTKGTCNRWVRLRGVDHNTGEQKDCYDCIDNWDVVLLRENAAMSRQAGAAVESFRNYMIEQNDQMIALASKQQKFIGGGDVIDD